jgi:nucleoside-diphosphate-sugar epimerase
MRVVLTGAAGRLGRVLLSMLQAAKHEVVATDMAPWADCPVPFAQVDLCDAAATTEVLRGCEGVVHAGAVPGPASMTPPGVDPAWGSKQRIGLEKLTPAQLLERNVSSAWNVFEGAARAGASRVVFSSSMFAMGWSHDPRAYRPRYLPIDEAHPPLPMETYGLSKVLGEVAAATAARISQSTARPMTIASLRFTNLVYPENENVLPWAAPTDEAPANILMWHWSKALEVATAHILALHAPSIGAEPHEAFLLCAPTTRFVENSVALAKKFYPEVPITRALSGPGNQALVDASKAQKILGWKPTTVDALRSAMRADA